MAVRSVLARLAGRLVTSPGAFLLAGVLDVVLYVAQAARPPQR